MKRHISSFVKSPIGYTLNLIVTATAATGIDQLPVLRYIDRHVLVPMCEALCLRDGVQNCRLF